MFVVSLVEIDTLDSSAAVSTDMSLTYYKAQGTAKWTFLKNLKLDFFNDHFYFFIL